MSKDYLSALDVQKALGCRPYTAFKLVQLLNSELEVRGQITRPGMVPREYFAKKCLEEGEPIDGVERGYHPL